jgi:lathosterol oxidase
MHGLITVLVPPPVHRAMSGWLSSWATQSSMPQEERLALIFEENEWKNSLVMWMFPESMQDAMPHWVQSWLRCWIMCTAVYLGVGAAWAYYTYFCFGDVLFTPGTIPGWKDVAEQMKVGRRMGVRRMAPSLRHAPPTPPPTPPPACT